MKLQEYLKHNDIECAYFYNGEGELRISLEYLNYNVTGPIDAKEAFIQLNRISKSYEKKINATYLKQVGVLLRVVEVIDFESLEKFKEDIERIQSGDYFVGWLLLNKKDDLQEI